MINYTEKGIGLHNEIFAAGHWLEQWDNVWVSSDDVAVQAIIDGYTIEQAIAEKQKQVSETARQKFDQVTAGISAAEMAGWPILLSEAARYRDDGVAGAAIQAEATIRGITLAALVTKIEENSFRFQTARAAIAGTDGRKRDEIAALASFADVAAYDVDGGWPL